MSEEVRYFRIGLFVVIAATLLAFALIIFGAGRIFEPRLYFETYVKGSVQGIDRGAPVRFRGVTIGQVSTVTFVFNEYPNEDQSPAYNYVMVEMEVTKPVFPRMFDGDLRSTVDRAVKNGLRVRIEPIGITGMNYMEMDFLDPEDFPSLQITWRPEHYYIPSAPGQLTSILDSINRIMRDVQNLELGELGDNLTSLLKNLNESVQEADLADLSKDARRLVNNLDTAVQQANFGELSADARALITNLDQVLKEADIQELSKSSRQAVDQIMTAAQDLQRVLDNLEPATRLNSDDINATLSNLRVMTDNLRVLSGDLRRYPSRLIWGGPPPPTDVFEDLPAEEPSPGAGRRPGRR